MANYGCQQILIHPNNHLRAILEFVCGESNKLANCGTYYARQLYFKTGKVPSKFDLHRLLKDNIHFQALYSHVAQQCLTTVAESFKSYLGLVRGIRKGTVTQKPRLPGYRTLGMNLATFPRADVRLKDGQLRFPLGSKAKAWFGLDAFYLQMPSNLEHSKLNEIRILPRNGQFYAEFVYKVEAIKADVDIGKVLGIDHGLNNWLTCLGNTGTSFIADGLQTAFPNRHHNSGFGGGLAVGKVKQLATAAFVCQCQPMAD